MSSNTPFTKENVEYYLKELAKEFRKRGHGIQVEIILVGGASVILNYDFRTSSYDIDAAYEMVSVMKESINAVGDKYGLPNGWINDEFKKTASYTPKIVQFSEYYKTFSHVLKVRTIRAEYLVAMKLVSGRQYKKDLSDIAGILYEQQLLNNPLNFEMIDKAICDLYGNWNLVPKYSKDVLEQILACKDLKSIFVELSENETIAKESLMEIERKYPNVLREDNVSAVIAAALEKKKDKQ